MSFPILIFWAFALVGMFTRGRIILYVFFGSWPFAAFAAVPPELTAGVTLTPAWVAAVLLFIKVIFDEGAKATAVELFDIRRSGLLTLCCLWGIASAFLFPRLFEGVIDVIPMRMATSQRPIGLHPQTANLTQTLYFAITLTTLVAAALITRHPERFKHAREALLFGGGVTVATGIADMIFGNSPLLSPFRTATYNLLTNAEMLNARRIVGLTPEASSFASICMIFLAPILLLRSTYTTAFTRNFTVPLIVILLVALTCLSTSATGYVGLIVLAVSLGGHWSWLALQRRPGWGVGMALFYGGVVTLLLVISFAPQVIEYPIDMFTEAVLKKTASDSFAERNLWNETSLAAFFSSYGLGVGLGSARASSWPISVLSNIGLPGAVLMMLFLAHVALARPTQPTQLNRLASIGLKFSLIPPLLMNAMSATAVNMGLSSSWVFGMIGGLSWAALQARPATALRTSRPKSSRQMRGRTRSSPAVPHPQQPAAEP